MKLLKTALIGVGGYGQFHLDTLRSLARAGSLRLAAVADPLFADGGNTLAEELRRDGCNVYPAHRELLEAESPDWIAIAAPIGAHEGIVRDSLATGAHLYLEKPPVPTLSQFHEMIALDPERRVTVGFHLTCLPTIRRLKQWIDSGRLGEIRRITAAGLWPRADFYYRRNGWAGRLARGGEPVFDGPATNGLSHLIHMLTFLAGQKAAQPDWVEAGFYRARPLESYDLASFYGRFANGVAFSAVVGHCAGKEMPFEIRVKGSRGSARITANGENVESDCGLDGFSDPTATAQAKGGFYREALAHALGQRENPPVSLGDCEGYLKITCGGFLSSGTIHDLPPGAVEIRGEKLRRFYHVNGLPELCQKSLACGLSLERLAPPWAAPVRRIATAALTRFSLADLTGSGAERHLEGVV